MNTIYNIAALLFIHCHKQVKDFSMSFSDPCPKSLIRTTFFANLVRQNKSLEK